jgi:hypothetical protein
VLTVVSSDRTEDKDNTIIRNVGNYVFTNRHDVPSQETLIFTSYQRYHKVDPRTRWYQHTSPHGLYLTRLETPSTPLREPQISQTTNKRKDECVDMFTSPMPCYTAATGKGGHKFAGVCVRERPVALPSPNYIHWKIDVFG